MNRLFVNLVACGVLVGGVAAAAEDDAVEKKLTAAKEEFAKSVEKAKAGLLADLKKRQDDAQKAGDLKLVEKAQAETKAFDTNGTLPKLVSVKSYESQLKTARAKLEDVYVGSVKQYTKDGKFATAKAIDKELDEFRKAGPAAPDTRKKWVHAKGDFTETKPGMWEEKSPNGKTYQYKEVARTKEYVELDAISGDTTLRFRLYDDHCDAGKRAAGTFNTLFNTGKWSR